MRTALCLRSPFRAGRPLPASHAEETICLTLEAGSPQRGKNKRQPSALSRDLFSYTIPFPHLQAIFRVHRNKLSPEAPGTRLCRRSSCSDSILCCRSDDNDSISHFGATYGVTHVNSPGPERRQDTEPRPAGCMDNANFKKSLLSQESFSLLAMTTVSGPPKTA